MSEELGGAPEAPQAKIAVAASPFPEGREPAPLSDEGARARLPQLPVARIDAAIESLSRFAGPAIFFLALGGLVWWLLG